MTCFQFDRIDDDGHAEAMIPEYRLMLAVIEDALVTFQTGLRSCNPIRRARSFEVEKWIRSRESDYVFSFESICSALGLDPACIRAGVLEMKRKVFTDGGRPRRLRLRRGLGDGNYPNVISFEDDAKEVRRAAR